MAKFASSLETLVAKKLPEATYEAEAIEYTIPEQKRRYIPDFKLPNGIYIEVKGKLDRDTKRKMRLVKAQNPDKDIRIVFKINNYLQKGKSPNRWRYDDWARINGFPCCFISPGKTVKQDKSWEEIVKEWESEAKNC